MGGTAKHGFLQVKGWERFQHYKDRSPPWIKLHRELLRDYEFSCLQDASKLHLMLIWLLASQLDNRIPNDPLWIQRQIGTAEPPDLKPLITAGFLLVDQTDSEPLAERKQPAMPETEAETDTSSSAAAAAVGHELHEPEARRMAREAMPQLDDGQIRKAWLKFQAHPNSKRHPVRLLWLRWIETETTRGDHGARGETAAQRRDRETAEALRATGLV